GLYRKAEKLHRQAFEFRRGILGDEHLDTLTSLANLASVRESRAVEGGGRAGCVSDGDEKASLLAKCYELRKRILGSFSLSSLRALNGKWSKPY
ncbi:uncharacterized protein K441DRAFT_536672, partial [Cenococcum geophilum 1.58]|uniref:uncharacterized protein n=1 Tax=Cenococcum geophilum 1.58 TaxID=794803 RepID=UPI00358E8332